MTTSKTPSRTDLMIQAVLAAPDNRLEIGYFDSEKYERLIRSARQFNKLPHGKDLTLKKDWRESKAWIQLVDQPAWMLESLAHIEVPEQLRKPSDVVTELRNRPDFQISRSEKVRALRLIDALVKEARRREYRVETTRAPRVDHWGYRDIEKDHGHFTITILSHLYRLTVSQEKDRVKHEPTKTEEARGYYPRYDQVVSGRFRFTIENNGRPFRASKWSDKPSRKLEDSLAEILQEVELRAEAAEQRRLDEIRQLEERKRQWALAREAAIEKLIEANRANELIRQIENWELTKRIDSYLAAIEEHLMEHPEQQQAAAEWVVWIKEYVDRINPLHSSLKKPADPKPTNEALSP